MDDTYSFDLKQYELINKIGVGKFGEVYKAKEISTGLTVAAKVSLTIFDEEEEKEKDQNLILNHVREVNIMSKLVHPSIVRFIGYSPIDFHGDARPVIITEFMSKGSLTKFIELERNNICDYKWDMTKKLSALYGIASAMAFLHAHNIIHRDLKPDNILMDDDLYPKIADFGFSKILHQNQNSISMASHVGFKGTAAYSPPEIILSDEGSFSKAGDVYAFSMIMYEIVTAKIPFKKVSYKTFCKKICSGQRPELDSSVPESYSNLIVRCWSQEPSDRPTFDEISDELKNERGFITELVDEDEFLNYVDYIDTYKTSFTKNRQIISINEFKKLKKEGKLEQMLEPKEIIQIPEATVTANPPESNEPKEESNKSDTDDDDDDDDGDNELYQTMKLLKSSVRYKAPKNTGTSEMPETNGAIKISEIDEMLQLSQSVKRIKVSEIEEEDCEELYQNWVNYYTGKGVPVNKELAASYCKRAADKGHVDAMYQYGKMLLNGDGIPVDKEEGTRYFLLAAENGHPEMFYNIGLMKKTGDGMEVDKAGAAEYLKYAAGKGHLGAIYHYVMMCIHGDGIPFNYLDAIKYLKIGADQGMTEMMYVLAVFLNSEDEGFPGDKKEAVRYFKMAADKGDKDSMLQYGLMKCGGDGCDADKDEGVQYIQMAVEKEHPKSMYAYAVMLIEGEYVDANKEEGMRYLKKSADAGCIQALNKYAYALLSGNNIEQNPKEAIRYTKISADKGSVEAMVAYARMISIDDIDIGLTSDKVESAKYFKMAADKGSFEAMLEYGKILIRGKGITQDIEEGTKYIKMAIEKGSTEVMFEYGKMLINGEEIQQDIEEGTKYFKMAIEKGSTKVMHEYGKMLINGDVVPQNVEEGIKYIKQAADAGYADSMNAYGLILVNGNGIPLDKKEGLKYLKMAADKGNEQAMFYYGIHTLNEDEITEENHESMKYIKMAADEGLIIAVRCYGSYMVLGKGVPANVEEGIKYLKMGADKDEPVCMYLYALVFYSGIGVDVDKKEAATYFKKASDEGHSDAMLYYGRMLFDGDAVPENKEEAVVYFKKSAAEGNDEAMTICGKLFYHGNCVQEDKKEAATYFKNAAEKGNAEAMNAYGIMLSKGEGVPIDEEEGARYIKMAEEKGYVNQEKEEQLKKIKELQSLINSFGGDLGIDLNKFFEAEGIKYSNKKEGTNLKTFSLFADRFQVSESRNNKIIVVLKTGEYNIVEPRCNFGADVSTSVDILNKNESFRIKLQSTKDKEDLLSAFSKALGTINKTPKDMDAEAYAPILIPSDLVRKCMICHTKFSIMNQRNHCNYCGRCICKKCIQKPIKLRGICNDEKKVCSQCFSLIIQDSVEHKNATNEYLVNLAKGAQAKVVSEMNLI